MNGQLAAWRYTVQGYNKYNIYYTIKFQTTVVSSLVSASYNIYIYDVIFGEKRAVLLYDVLLRAFRRKSETAILSGTDPFVPPSPSARTDVGRDYARGRTIRKADVCRRRPADEEKTGRANLMRSFIPPAGWPGAVFRRGVYVYVRDTI